MTQYVYPDSPHNQGLCPVPLHFQDIFPL